MNDSITVKSLGRTALIGTLYNANQHEFINDVRLFDFNKLQQKFVQSLPLSYSFKKTCDLDTYLKKSELINLSGDLVIKSICMPNAIKGSAKFLNEFNFVSRLPRSYTLYSHSSIFETINLLEIFEYYKENKLSLNSSLFEGATHVVTGITWGIETIIINDGSSSYQIISDFSSLDIETENLNCVNDTINKVPNVLEKLNNGKGMQIEFQLASLEKVRKIFQFRLIESGIISNKINESFYENFYEIMEKLTIPKQINLQKETYEKRAKLLKSQFYAEVVNFKSFKFTIMNVLESILQKLDNLKVKILIYY